MSTRLTWLTVLVAAVAAMSAITIAPPRALAATQYAAAAQDPDGHSTDYWAVTSAGVVVANGGAPNLGSLSAAPSAPIVGMAAAAGGGYWLVGSDGGVFSYGAGFYGSMGGQHLNAPIVAMAGTPDGKGYWLVGSDGGLFSFGDAGFYGSMGNTQLTAPVVGIASTPDGKGYWMVGADGGVFNFGDAGFFGSMGNRTITASIVGLEPTPDGQGYWLVGSDGDVYSFGDAGSYGSMLGRTLPEPVIGMVSSPDGGGYRLFDGNGAVYDFGDFDASSTTSAPTTGTSPPASTGTSTTPAPLPSPARHGHHTVRVRAALGWRWAGAITRLRKVRVLHIPAHVLMTATCTGHGCPRRACTRPITGARRIRRHLLALRGIRFHEGDLWHVSFTRRGWRAQRLLFTFRHGRSPLVAVVRPAGHHRHTHRHP